MTLDDMITKLAGSTEIYSIDCESTGSFFIWGPEEFREQWAVEYAEMIHRDTGDTVRIYKNGKWWKKVG